MEIEKVMKSGCYIITNLAKKEEKYLVLISGSTPFLKKEIIWDCDKNEITTDDVLRGEEFDWFEVTCQKIFLKNMC